MPGSAKDNPQNGPPDDNWRNTLYTIIFETHPQENVLMKF